jgi:ferritin heavy chain
MKHSRVFLFQGAHFSKDTVNRPGFAKMFFESASEEREHAIKIISYLLLRGELTSDVSTLIQNPVCNHMHNRQQSFCTEI